jgi:hypothetical protein
MFISAADEIKQVQMERPHVVILGAGASLAALPNGDKSGKGLPLMDNFIATLGIESLINKTGLTFKSNNFEDIYSAIHSNPDLSEIRAELEEIVYSYFVSMALPDEPTIYDHLVLSLRPKDVIATFNWDPFLAQAIERNMGRFKPPTSIYLHGNVKMGACSSNHHMGLIGTHCMRCGNKIEPSRLFYPVGEKNYHNNEFISKQWEMIVSALKSAFMVTIFGYGAPTSDASAVGLFKKAWGSVNKRNMEEFEVIDKKNEDDIKKTWSPFIHSHHYRVENNFYDSWIANHPRRTGEAYLNQFLEAKFIENNPLPQNATFKELWGWYDVLYQYE